LQSAPICDIISVQVRDTSRNTIIRREPFKKFSLIQNRSQHEYGLGLQLNISTKYTIISRMRIAAKTLPIEFKISKSFHYK